MLRFFFPRFVVAVLLLGALPSSAAHAAAADLFVVSGVQVDATAVSATAARDQALADGRSVAWQRLFRRLTPPAVWSKQPQLDDNALQRIVRSFEVSNERRSTTRYLGEITYRFNGGEVQRLLRQSSIAYTDTQAKPVLLIPLVDGKYSAASPWTEAWTHPSIAQGLVPVVLPTGDAADLALLSRPDISQLDWAALTPLAKRYDVTGIVLASATMDGNSVQLTEWNAAGRQSELLAFAHSTFAATAEAASLKIAEGWKTHAAIDYSQRGRIAADVQFGSFADWMRIRSQLSAIRSITDMDVIGVSLHEAQIELSYYGRPEQLKEAMDQQDLNLTADAGQYSLQLAVNSPPGSP